MKDKNDIIILKSRTDINTLDQLRANLGCDICPCCGETRDFDVQGDKLIGVSSGSVQTEYVGMRLFKYGRIFVPPHIAHRDVWSCATCGATWMSRPYTVSDRRKDHIYLHT